MFGCGLHLCHAQQHTDLEPGLQEALVAVILFLQPLTLVLGQHLLVQVLLFTLQSVHIRRQALSTSPPKSL